VHFPFFFQEFGKSEISGGKCWIFGEQQVFNFFGQFVLE
jgi:hypothetical protein